MNQDEVTNLFVRVRQINGMLQLLDAEKHNPLITLGELHEKFESQYKTNPASEEFNFYNQYQFITSLLAYVCLPSERFYSELPDTEVGKLPAGWGTSSLTSSYSLRDLVRHMRNAISHGHVSVTPELLFWFNDRQHAVVFNHVSLHQFCQALAYWCLTKDASLSGL